MCVGDGEAFQQRNHGKEESRGIRCARRASREGREEGETKKVVVGSREICKRKREKRKRKEESRKSVKIEGKERGRGREKRGMGHPRGAGRI